jgi:glycosyltransferase involved in cell wall biosynthesis
MKKISIVSPCFNEEDNVQACAEVVRRLFETELSGYAREHIFCDNASTDRTVEILRQIAAADANVKVVVNARNFGLFRSTFNGLRYATGDATLVMLPVDLQDPPELLPTFVRHWEAGYPIVYGIRSVREEGLLFRTARRTFYWIVNRLSDFEIPENVGEFQLIDRVVLNQVLKFEEKYPYIRGIIAACGFPRKAVPYTWRSRKRGFSKNSLPTLIDNAFNGILSFTNIPMRLCTYSGFILATLSIVFSLGMFVAYFANSDYVPRGITTLLVGLFFLSGVQLIFIGVLGEYVTSIHSQVRRGPMVIERELINISGRRDSGADSPLEMR